MGKVFGWILGIGTFVGAIYLWWSKRNDISDLRTALEVQSIRERVAAREATLEQKLADATVSAAHIETLQGIITDNKAAALVLATKHDLTGKTDQEIADLFTRSVL